MQCYSCTGKYNTCTASFCKFIQPEGDGNSLHNLLPPPDSSSWQPEGSAESRAAWRCMPLGSSEAPPSLNESWHKYRISPYTLLRHGTVSDTGPVKKMKQEQHLFLLTFYSVAEEVRWGFCTSSVRPSSDLSPVTSFIWSIRPI